MTSIVHVAVGVIYREKKVFLTKRAINAHQGGKWEFPGGKVEQGETVSQALARELKEEVGIEVLSCQPLTVIKHDYGDKQVCLDVFIVDNFLFEPKALEGQEQAWYKIEHLDKLDFPEANKEIVSLLTAQYC
ncbi:MAG: 8-oxo-dGTP diphosphatase MutT [Colwellia sp.]|nr:8-oxo-dGTP diphosphatase MutT [Colwellia sp.]